MSNEMKFGAIAGLGAGVLQMTQQTAYQMVMHGPIQGSLAVGVAAGMHVAVTGFGIGCEGEGSFFDPILRMPAKMAEKIVGWMTPAQNAENDIPDQRPLQQRVAILSTTVVAALSTLTAHVVCLSTAALPFSPLLLGAAFGAHNYIMGVLTDFTGEKLEGLGYDILGKDSKLDEINFNFRSFFDRLILKVDLQNDPSKLDSVKSVSMQWGVVAFVVASVALTAFLSSSVLACTAAYPLAALVGTLVKRYYQIGAAESGKDLGDDLFDLVPGGPGPDLGGDGAMSFRPASLLRVEEPSSPSGRPYSPSGFSSRRPYDSEGSSLGFSSSPFSRPPQFESAPYSYRGGVERPGVFLGNSDVPRGSSYAPNASFPGSFE